MMNEPDLTKTPLTFDKPDFETFRCLPLAISAGKTGGTMPAVLNGANEAAVALFLNGKIRFLDIADLVEGAMCAHKTMNGCPFPKFLRRTSGPESMYARNCIHYIRFFRKKTNGRKADQMNIIFTTLAAILIFAVLVFDSRAGTFHCGKALRRESERICDWHGAKAV